MFAEFGFLALLSLCLRVVFYALQFGPVRFYTSKKAESGLKFTFKAQIHLIQISISTFATKVATLKSNFTNQTQLFYFVEFKRLFL